ncbi:MAG: DUF4344 domain-containing metallopeptidase [Pseudomonadota bacterium]
MVVKSMTVTAAVLLMAVMPAAAVDDEDKVAFVENNLLYILFHEAGHAVIDQFGLPVLGQEEDAADAFATIEIMNVYEDPLPILADSAIAQFIMDERLDGDYDVSDYYGSHDLDIQRGYRVICHAVGIEPDEYLVLAEDLGLDRDRIETCEDEGWLAAESWEVLLEPSFIAEDEISSNVVNQYDIDGLSAPQESLLLDNGLMDEFSAYLSETFDWPAPVTVTIELCNEANAFYDPATVTISMCAEFVDELIDLAADL